MTQIPNLVNLFSWGNIVVYMLVFTRLTGLIQSAPFLSTIQAPIMTRLWFAATIAFIFYPMVKNANAFILPSDMVEFTILLAIEFFIGYLIGFVANLLLEGVRMAGNILSIQMGTSMSQALDPATGVQSPEISTLYIYLTTLVFLMTGAYQFLFVILFNSFESVPMGLLPLFDSNIVTNMIHLFSQIFKIAFGVALPIFSVLLISDILLGLMSKMMPHMNIYMVAIPVKIYIGLFLIFAFLGATATYLRGMIEKYIQMLVTLFG